MSANAVPAPSAQLPWQPRRADREAYAVQTTVGTGVIKKERKAEEKPVSKNIDTMEQSSLKALLHSVTEFGLVSSGSNAQLESVRRCCQKINHILENFKPVYNELVASEVSLDVQLVKELAELDAAINEARGLVLSWHLMMSKIFFVLQMETIVTKIYSSMHQICQVVASALSSPVNSMAVECIKELQCMGEKQISVVIEKAIRDQSDNGFSSSEYLDMISNSLSLLSNEELLMEIVKLEKLKVKLGLNDTLIEIEDIDGIIALVTYMHDCYTKIHQLHTINGMSVPADFCCPLSLDLMSDPVIVASGQTYERAFIRKWLDQGINVCPRTRQTLGHSNLIPNYTVKALIANWCESNDIKLPDPLNSTSSNLPSFFNLTDVSTTDLVVSHSSHAINTDLPRAPESYRKATSHEEAHSPNGLTSQETRVSEKPVSPQHSSSSSVATLQMDNGLEANHSGVSLATTETNNESSVETRNAHSGSQIVGQSEQDVTDDNLERPGDANLVSWVSSDLAHYNSDALGELAQDSQTSSASKREPKFPLGFVEAHSRSQNMWRRPLVPRILSSQSLDSRSDLSGVESEIRKLVEGLKSDSVDIQRNSTGELRLLARHKMENRIVIANCGAISLLVGLLYSIDPKTQENAVTALLNLSINDNNKIAIGNANSIDPLIHVLETGNAEAKENAAATLYSLSVIEENKVRIGRSGAIAPLVELLASGTPRGKKDAATALFNLSIFHENKARIVQAGAVRYLVELMDPAAGMVDKAVAVLSNLASTPEGRTAIGQAGGIPGLVEVIELGSARGKENAASALLHLCTNSSRYCSIVLQEGAVPPLVALSQSGTPRAKEKAQTLLSYFRSQRLGNAGRR